MGKNKYIETPEIMWQHFLDYKQSIKDNPILVKDWVGKDADEVHKPKERPLTFIGFQNYLDDIGIINVVEQYFENREDRYKDYVGICSRIKRNIQQDQIEGGMVNIYNPSITQRLNGLTDNVDLTTKGKEIQTTPTSIQVEIIKNEDTSD
jgi:hypothetical protein